MSPDPREIEEFFHRKIPIVRAMGLSVVSYDGQELILEAPLELNHNHLGTAFGGSLNAVATLAGYGLVWLELRDPGCHVVIRDSSIRFRRPVREKILAVCRRPDEVTMSRFTDEFTCKGKASLRLNVTIMEAGLNAVDFEGTFVAMR